jgi:predicted amidohydrolase
MTFRAIGAAQTIPVRGDVSTNVDEHLRLARLAAEEGVRLLVFPELSLTGYELDLAERLAFSRGDARLAPLLDAAAELSMTLVVGAPARLGTKLQLGAFILSPDRAIDVYTKHHLGAFPPSANPGGSVPPPEASVFAPGDRNPLVRLGDGLAAVAVCADVGQPSHAKAAAERGARSYLASMFVIPADFPGDTAKLRSYAVQHAMVVLLANFGGPSGGLPSAGGSAIWSERGEPLVQLGAAGSGVAVAVEQADGWRTRALTGVR